MGMNCNVRKMLLVDATKTMCAVQTVYDRVPRNAWTTTNTDHHVG